MAKKPLRTRAKTGETGPESGGVWKIVESPSTTAPSPKATECSPHNNSAVTRELVQYA